MDEPNFRDELEEVWVPKDVGELEGLLLTIQNEPGKKILKHKIQQILRKRSIAGNWQDWDDLEWPDEIDGPWPDWNNHVWPNWDDEG
ncbi:MAG: hypothetical protein L7H10_06270 [Vulcanisaeta sp.]|nr:hypothetical protein [Vulcanisaeta sp.]MCG2870339.1 hypothetical protein [Vulcanisaeta sp.]